MKQSIAMSCRNRSFACLVYSSPQLKFVFRTVTVTLSPNIFYKLLTPPPLPPTARHLEMNAPGGHYWKLSIRASLQCRRIFGAGALNNPSLLSSWARKRERAGASQK